MMYKLSVFCSFSKINHSGTCRQASARKPRHGHLHNYEPWIRGPFQPARQSEEAVPQSGHDHARPSAHRRGDAVQPRVPHCGEAGLQDRAFLQVSTISGTTIDLLRIGRV